MDTMVLKQDKIEAGCCGTGAQMDHEACEMPGHTDHAGHGDHGDHSGHGGHKHDQNPGRAMDHSFHGKTVGTGRKAAVSHNAHAGHMSAGSEGQSNLRLAVAATLHCLVGCGIGEIVGIVIGTALGLDMWTTMGLGLGLGFVFGLALGMVPLLRSGFGPAQALKTVLIAEGLSIVVMEAAEALVQIYTPGVMMAGLSEPLFWMGMAFALSAGFLAALPVNVWLISRGIRHAH